METRGLSPHFGSDTTNGVTTSTTPNQWDTGWCLSCRAERGNLATTTSLNGTSTFTYDQTGTVTQAVVNGVTSTVTTNATTNYTAPSQISVGSLSTSMSYDGTSLLPLSSTGPNGATTSMSWDSVGRPSSSTSPFGATTTTTYTLNAGLPSNPGYSTTTVNGRWVKTTVDGFGRPTKVETGDASGTKSSQETVYAPCGCTPLGKMSQTTTPHVPGGTQNWTTYVYDGIGRTLSAQAPDGSTTYYSYVGNTVTVTDPAGKWKKYTLDAFNHILQVNEPNPAGGSDYVTTYTYDSLDHLTGVTMPRPTGTQTRSFSYSGAFLMSATNPENGTVSYTYNTSGAAYGKVATKTDAKGQQVQHSYDSLGWLHETRRYISFMTEQDSHPMFRDGSRG